MPQTRIYHSRRELAVPTPSAVITHVFTTAYYPGARSTKAYPAIVPLEKGLLYLLVKFAGKRLSAISTTLTLVVGHEPKLTDDICQQVLSKLQQDVPLFRHDPALRRQLTLYVEQLPTTLAASNQLADREIAELTSLDQALANCALQPQ